MCRLRLDLIYVYKIVFGLVATNVFISVATIAEQDQSLSENSSNNFLALLP